ncbi:Lysophospholipase L1 [Rhizobiales bacterium GAS188]|nr:Lysophospholipase L1 [Rhizobiales bacterium GAS188]
MDQVGAEQRRHSSASPIRCRTVRPIPLSGTESDLGGLPSTIKHIILGDVTVGEKTEGTRSKASPPSRIKEFVFSIAILVVSTGVALMGAEVFLRIKNSSMHNYDIEMWRYSGLLKQRSGEPLLGFEHIPSSSATLESVEIRTNEWGLRGGPVPPLAPGQRRILFLGSSITLGWGVPEDQTITSRIQQMFAADGQNVQVLNAGIGNYNSVRYVNRFLLRLTDLHPTDIVVDGFVRDAEALDPGGGNVLLRNSELAVTSWIAMTRLFKKEGSETVEDHYRAVYTPEAPGFLAMKDALRKLADYGKEHNVRIYFAMTPEVHDLVDYKLGFVHDIMKSLSQDYGFIFVDLLPSMSHLTPAELWAMPGDPHPNGLGHQRMAEALYPALKLKTP